MKEAVWHSLTVTGTEQQRSGLDSGESYLGAAIFLALGQESSVLTI